MWRRPSRFRWKATMWWWICDFPVIPGRCEASNPESRDSGFALSRAPEMTPVLFLRAVPHHTPLPRIAHQRGVAIDAVHELAVGHGDEQRKYHAEMQRQQRSHGGGVAPQQQRDAGEA